MGFFDKLFSGLGKTRKNMQELEALFQDYAPDDEDFYDDLEELLVLSDVGGETAEKVVKGMKRLTWEKRFRRGQEAREGLVELLSEQLQVGDTALKLDSRPAVILMVGVNGVGKTTTIGKLAHQLIAQDPERFAVVNAEGDRDAIAAEIAGKVLARLTEAED